ncbi:MAG: 30S ribosomal protein S4 [Thermoplasmata archaeon]|jgi:small subunit ribosomal protein S4|nr:30S ribosomal protein S4 [Thermoplasmata archaeon]MVT13864.1 30S ribosomal protein S4 [Euryarchaeota archaeon]
MGDPKFNRKLYESPRRPWEKERIAEENKLLNRYGLKNKRELWKAQSILRNFRAQARRLQALIRYNDPQAKKELDEILKKLVRYGLLDQSNASIDAILTLTIDNILDRRLETVVFKLGLANTLKQARQFITHGHIMVGDRVVSIPGYFVKKDEEGLIKYNPFSPLANELHPMRQKPKEGAE